MIRLLTFFAFFAILFAETLNASGAWICPVAPPCSCSAPSLSLDSDSVFISRVSRGVGGVGAARSALNAPFIDEGGLNCGRIAQSLERFGLKAMCFSAGVALDGGVKIEDANYLTQIRLIKVKTYKGQTFITISITIL